MDRQSIAAVIPAYNEEKHIGDVVRRTRQQLDNVLVVDDGSRDKTAERAREAAGDHRPLRPDDRGVDVVMTLTTPNCPAAGELPTMVENAIASVPGVGVVNVNLVWEPAWSPDRMSHWKPCSIYFGKHFQSANF